MEMPVMCKCGEWIELDSTRESPLKKDQLLCRECFSSEDKVNDLIQEAKDIQYDLDNDAEYMKGDRRGWKKRIKEIKEQVKKLGYNYDDYDL